MSDQASDRNLLFGLLALQMDFVSRDQLISGMHAWVLEKSRPLGEILVEQGHLARERRTLLEALVQEHLQQHSGDPQQSLAAVSSIKSVRQELEQLADPDVAASLVHVSQNAPSVDPYATRAAQGGEFPSTATRFRVLRPHAKGGLGQVSVALDEELHREVALKEIQSQHADRDDSRGRFLVEAEITGGLEHPGIVPVYSLGSYQDGRPYYAMRFIKGDNLKEAIERFHRSSHSPAGSEPAGYESVAFRNLLGRFMDVCNAIAYAHSRGVLHRDLKPGNIMLGDYGETLVVDWGLAKSLKQTFRAGSSPAETDPPERPLEPRSGSGSAPTIEGSAIGTPQFMSPEQAAGRIEELGPASDVYSLGATLHCVLTGDPPFGGDSIEDVLRNVQRGEFRRPRAVNERIPKPLEAITLKAMAINPGDRYGSAKELAEEVERYLADEPVLAYAEPWAVRARRWMKQHRSLVTGTAAATLVALVGLLIGLMIMGNYNRELAGLNHILDERNEKLTAALSREQAALEAERRAKEIAQTERNRAETVTETLVSAFRSPAPDRDGREVTVLEVLARTEIELLEQLKDHPLELAALMNAIGRSYYALGQFRKAIAPSKLSRDLRLENLGPNAPKTLESQNTLGVAYMSEHLYDEALPILESTFFARKKVLGFDHADTLQSQTNLALIYKQMNRINEAIELYKQTIQIMRKSIGTNARDTLIAQHNLAAAYMSVSETELALLLFEKTFLARKEQFGPDHPDTLSSCRYLGKVYHEIGRSKESVNLLQQTLLSQRKVLGVDHPHTLITQGDLSQVHWELGQFNKAIWLLEQEYLAKKTKYGADDSRTHVTQIDLASMYDFAGYPQRAIPHLEQALQRKVARLGENHKSTLSTKDALASAYDEAGRSIEAVSIFEEVLAARKIECGPHHRDTLTTQDHLASAYARVGQMDEALSLFKQTLRERMENFGKDDIDTLVSVHNLGLASMECNRSSETVDLLEEWQQGIDTNAAAHWFAPRLQMVQGMALRRVGKYALAQEKLTAAYTKLYKTSDLAARQHRKKWLYEAARELSSISDSEEDHARSISWLYEASKYFGPAVAEPREGFMPLDLKPTAKPASE